MSLEQELDVPAAAAGARLLEGGLCDAERRDEREKLSLDSVEVGRDLRGEDGGVVDVDPRAPRENGRDESHLLRTQTMTVQSNCYFFWTHLVLSWCLLGS